MQQHVGLAHLLWHVVIINRANHFYTLTSFRVLRTEIGELPTAYLPQRAHNVQLQIVLTPQSREHRQNRAEHILMPQRARSQQPHPSAASSFRLKPLKVNPVVDDGIALASVVEMSIRHLFTENRLIHHVVGAQQVALHAIIQSHVTCGERARLKPGRLRAVIKVAGQHEPIHAQHGAHAPQATQPVEPISPRNAEKQRGSRGSQPGVSDDSPLSFKLARQLARKKTRPTGSFSQAKKTPWLRSAWPGQAAAHAVCETLQAAWKRAPAVDGGASSSPARTQRCSHSHTRMR